MKYSKEFIRELERLSYYVNDPKDEKKPDNWYSVRKYRNDKTGFKAEAFENNKGDRVLIFAGTDPLTTQDINNDIKLARNKIPQQAYEAYLAYEDFNNRYKDGGIILSGYSLGGSLTQIISNETGTEGITFAAYGVGNIVEPKNVKQITNYGNENDPIFKINYQNQLGTNYIIPDDNTSLGKGFSINKHLPNRIGDVSKAIKANDLSFNAMQKAYILDNYIKKNLFYNDKIFDISNRVFYSGSGTPIKEMSDDEIKYLIEQYYNEGETLPEKSELDRRVRFGELIYVNDYIRSDGVKVSGYYRRYPQQ